MSATRVKKSKKIASNCALRTLGLESVSAHTCLITTSNRAYQTHWIVAWGCRAHAWATGSCDCLVWHGGHQMPKLYI